MEAASAILTIGHSNRSAQELVALLRRHGVQLLVDVRAFPGSRRQPWFAKDAVRETLATSDIDYAHLRDLGGRRRRAAVDDPGAGCGDGWRNSSFRAYAEYVQTPEYDQALELLIELAARRTAIMCSEAVPWRCHRWLVADTLVARGIRVLHIVGDGPLRRHELSPFADVADEHVTWPGPPSAQSLRLGAPVS